MTGRILPFRRGDEKAKGTIKASVRPYCETSVTVERANGLRNADGMMGKSDPYVIVKGLDGNVWGETRIIKDDLNPVFGETFVVNILNRMPLGGKLGPLKIKVMDSDSGIMDSTDDPLGAQGAE